MYHYYYLVCCTRPFSEVQHYFKIYFNHGEHYTLIIEGSYVSDNILSFGGYLVCLSSDTGIMISSHIYMHIVFI